MTTTRALLSALFLAVLLSPMLWSQAPRGPATLPGISLAEVVAAGAEACPECTFWFNGNACADTGINDSDENGLCDISDDPDYQMDTVIGTEFTLDTTTVFTNCCGSDSTIELISNAAIEAPALPTGNLYGMLSDAATPTQRWSQMMMDEGSWPFDEGRIGMLISFNAIGTGSDHIAQVQTAGHVNSGSNQVRMVLTGTGGDEIAFQWTDGGGDTIVATSTAQNIAADTWYFLEFAWCFNGASEACTINLGTNKSGEGWINGVSVITDDNSAFGAWDTAQIIMLNTAESDTTHESVIALIIIVDEDGLDIWDRYAGTCSEGVTRCFANAQCTGTCDNPVPVWDYPGT